MINSSSNRYFNARFLWWWEIPRIIWKHLIDVFDARNTLRLKKKSNLRLNLFLKYRYQQHLISFFNKLISS